MARSTSVSWKRFEALLAILDRAVAAERTILPPLRGQRSAALLRRIRRESDTGLVLVLTLWVEQALTDLIRAFFVADGHAGTLLKNLSGKLDLKIALASALGIFPPDQREDADLLKNIRNKFAHRVLTGTFADRDVAPLVDRLAYAEPHPRWSRRLVVLHTADRLVQRARVAKRMVDAMHRGDMSLRELRGILSVTSNGDAKGLRLRRLPRGWPTTPVRGERSEA